MKSRSLIRGALAFAVLSQLVPTPWAHAADRQHDAAPRIALALSGGGARGIAHVGVLKVLEELRVPVHCVVGTSMGAIVGGTFAAGRSTSEMEAIVLAANWPEIFRDRPPRREMAVRRKIDEYKPLFGFELGLRDGALVAPKGLIAGVSIESFFREMAQPAADVSDFDRLPVPFRAIATDLETGAAVVLRSGSVAQAMRASMSVPGAIAPVEIDGRLLVDGGLADNLPIVEARQLCGDVVIAVNISTPPLQRDQIRSVTGVTAQVINFLGLHTVKERLRTLTPKDVLITPDLGDITATGFDRAQDAIRIGEEAARLMAQQLQRYSLPPDQYAAQRGRQLAAADPRFTVDEIRIEGLDRTNPAVVMGLVESQPGQMLTERIVATDLRRIFGTGDYEAISYRVLDDADGRRMMLIEPTEKSIGPDYVRFGLALATDFSGDNAFNVRGQLRRTWLNTLGAEWLSEAQIGAHTFIASEWYQPLHVEGRWFVAPSLYAGVRSRGVFVNEDKLADFRIRMSQLAVDGGLRLGTWGQLRAGLAGARINARVETGSPLLPSERDTSVGPRAAMFVDQTDQAWFPRAGYGAIGTAYRASTALGSDKSFSRVELSGRAATSWGPHTFYLSASGGSAVGSDLPAYGSFTLGGPLRLSAYRVDELAGREYVFGRLMYYNRTLRLPELLGYGLFLGGSAEIGRITDRAGGLPPAGTAWSVSAFLAAVTLLGPGYVGIGAGPGRWSLYLLFGAPGAPN
ncbi:MAG: patatin-like phospholipase family protein [Burkholderiales bacterium]|nr:patatin-like phospholipase family protein [Burkholderiales bacterium]